MNPQSIQHELAAWPAERIEGLVREAGHADIDAALDREERTPADLAALLSPCARGRLEEMAREAQRLTRWHFGRTIALYAPIYLSNVCAADCLYCGFAAGSGMKQKRTTLKPDEIRRECESLAAHGFETVLLLTGEAPNVTTIDYIAQAVAIADEYFSSVCIEMYSMGQTEYARLCEAGLEGMTLYMETYDRETYRRMHPSGIKKDYEGRIEAYAEAGAAGVRKLNLGVLLGLFDWRVDGFWLALHARYLQRRYWQSAVAVSFPRLRHTPARFQPPVAVGDADLVQLLLAMRLFLPEAGLLVSTRESAAFRDRLIPLGITQMSAGSSTRPGGYATCGDETLEQFEIEDTRTPDEVVQAIIRAGYDPVWKDFDRAFHHGATFPTPFP